MSFFICIGAQIISKGKEAKQEGTNSFSEHQTHLRMHTKRIRCLKDKVKIDIDDQMIGLTHSWTIGCSTN